MRLTSQELKLLSFLLRHNLVFHPYYSLQEHAKKLDNRNGYCLCDPTRPKCPCDQVLIEIKQQGHCKCMIFWKKKKIQEVING